MLGARCATLPVLLSLDGNEAPSEFRLFRAGENPTSKGSFWFDDAAAESVMAAFAEHGAELPIDLEHLSVAAEAVTGDARNFNPDAQGWFSLEVRGGELWAVNVTWTPEGAQRLRERRQRYVSPAFNTDAANRVIEIMNVALTAMPATHNAMPLVATARDGAKRAMSTETLSVDVKKLQAVAKVLEVDPTGDIGEIIAAVVGFGDALKAAATGEAPKGEKSENKDEPKAEEPMSEPEPDAESKPEPEAAKVMRASAEEIETLRNEASTLRAQLVELRAERDAREAVERRELVAQLVKLGRETPGTAWQDADGTVPKGMLATAPLAELRERVKAFSGAPVVASASAAMAPAGVPAGLSAEQLRICNETGCDPQIFAAIQSRRVSA